jgi:glycosidase
MNYRFGYSVVGFVSGKITASELDDRLEMLHRDTPAPNFHTQMNVLDSHDTARTLTLFGGSKEKVMLAAAIQLAYPGVPMIYYGSEAGIEGSYAEGGRRAYPWGGEDERLLRFYRRAINARRASKALSEGEVRSVWIADPGGYGFMRRHGEEAVIALFNMTEQPLQAVVPLRGMDPGGEWRDLLGTLPPTTLKSGVLIVTVPALSAAWLEGRA